MTIRTIAASAALALGVLAAVPGVAMASTAATASTAGSSARPVPVRCPHPGRKAGPVHPPVVACAGQQMTFDMPAFATTATELSGPRLTAHELVIYQRHVFMIRSVHGRAFTLARLPVLTLTVPHGVVRKRHAVTAAIRLSPFRNGANAITDGHAIVIRALVAITVRISPRRLSRRCPFIPSAAAPGRWRRGTCSPRRPGRAR